MVVWNDGFVLTPLLVMAHAEFPALMRHAHNREDAWQVMRLVQWSTRGVDAVESGRHALAWLEYELGLRSVKPGIDKPEFPGPDEFLPSRITTECDEAFRIERSAA